MKRKLATYFPLAVLAMALVLGMTAALIALRPSVSAPTVNAAPSLAHATAPTLGAAATFAVLGNSTVTNTGTTVITGDLGLSPGTSVTGFPPGTVSGGIHAADALALSAQTALTTAFTSITAQTCDTTLAAT
jgi:hypothetical protein